MALYGVTAWGAFIEGRGSRRWVGIVLCVVPRTTLVDQQLSDDEQDAPPQADRSSWPINDTSGQGRAEQQPPSAVGAIVTGAVLERLATLPLGSNGATLPSASLLPKHGRSMSHGTTFSVICPVQSCSSSEDGRPRHRRAMSTSSRLGSALRPATTLHDGSRQGGHAGQHCHWMGRL